MRDDDTRLTLGDWVGLAIVAGILGGGVYIVAHFIIKYW